MTKYDSEHHNPPAPVAWVTIEDPATGKKICNVPMLIDSGADVTLLPSATIVELGLERDTSRGFELEGYDGSRCIVHPVKAVLEVGSFRFKGEYLHADRAIGVLGRGDILNRVVLELDGPNFEWSMRRAK